MSLKLPSSASYNGTPLDQTQTQTANRFPCLVPFTRRHSRSVTIVASSPRSATSDVAVEANGHGLEKLGQRLRMGSLEENKLSYKEKFVIRCYEVGSNKTATIQTIANLIQEAGVNHAQSLGSTTDGFATAPSMRKLHLIWVTARMDIEVYRYPSWSDVVEIETWAQTEGRINTRRCWIIKDYSTGEIIGRATSKWVMMNQDTRRVQKITNEILADYQMYFVKGQSRLAFHEENNASLKKIAKLEDSAQHSHLGLTPRRSDLDMNHHVNNVTYIGWVLESMPQETIDTHELQTISLEFRRECQHNDIVDSLTSVEPAKIEQDKCQFLHLVKLSVDGLEINRGRTVWRKKSAQ